MPNLAESSVETVAAIAVSVVLAFVVGWAVAYGHVRAALRKERVADADATREAVRRDAEVEREAVEKDNNLWRSECERLVAMHAEDRKRWIEELREIRQQVKQAEEAHVECKQEVARLRRLIEEGGGRGDKKKGAGG